MLAGTSCECRQRITSGRGACYSFHTCIGAGTKHDWGRLVKKKLILTGVVVALAGFSAPTAQATDLWSGRNYQGTRYYTYQSGAFVNSFDNTASSIDADRKQTYHEHVQFRGRSFTSSRDWNDLGSATYNLGFGENWNDRISSITWVR